MDDTPDIRRTARRRIHARSFSGICCAIYAIYGDARRLLAHRPVRIRSIVSDRHNNLLKTGGCDRTDTAETMKLGQNGFFLVFVFVWCYYCFNGPFGYFPPPSVLPPDRFFRIMPFPFLGFWVCCFFLGFPGQI